MNEELLQQLYEQARINAGKSHGFNTTNIEVANELTKLIVEECAAELLKWKSEPFPYDPGVGAIVIKKRFGLIK